MKLFKKLKEKMVKTRESLSLGLELIFVDKREIDDEFIEELEELFITSDMGIETTMHLMEKIASRPQEINDVGSLKELLRNEAVSFFEPYEEETEDNIKPKIIMIVGVNGTGKTTTLGKLAYQYNKEGKKTLIAAADTFRAAAIEQLSIWAERADSDIVKHKHGADPASVVYDSIEAATARNADILLIDTAGRLHTQVNLMEELKKIKRTVQKKYPDAPHETILVLDATTGQNALYQAKFFHEAIGINSIALTKLDGTAKGGIILAISNSINVPVKYIGIGEQIEDLQPFDAEQFIKALF
jgi:fused signal recognition particle receptor